MQDYLFDALDLQLFADGGGDGGGASAAGSSAVGGAESGAATTGVTTPAAGETYEDRLIRLGVPKDKIRARKPAAQPKMAAQATTSATPDAATTATAAKAAESATQAAAVDTDKPTRMSWDEILKDPDYNKSMQETVKSRLADAMRNSNNAKNTLKKLAPVLDALGAKYKLDTTDLSKLDVDALTVSVSKDESYYEGKADELGITPDFARQQDAQERQIARNLSEQQQILEEQKMQQHIESIRQQSQALKQLYPTFDLNAEMQNPAFVRLTAPNSPISVEDAYVAIHRKEIQSAMAENVAQKAAAKIAASVQAGASRPVENGASSQGATTTQFDMTSKESRDYIKQQMQAAARRGEKYYPPNMRR